MPLRTSAHAGVAIRTPHAPHSPQCFRRGRRPRRPVSPPPLICPRRAGCPPPAANNLRAICYAPVGVGVPDDPPPPHSLFRLRRTGCPHPAANTYRTPDPCVGAGFYPARFAAPLLSPVGRHPCVPPPTDRHTPKPCHCNPSPSPCKSTPPAKRGKTVAIFCFCAILPPDRFPHPVQAPPAAFVRPCAVL